MRSHGFRPWRSALRARLLAARTALDAATRESHRRAIDAKLELHFPLLSQSALGWCWPIRGEYDARELVARLHARGARLALPVIVAPQVPLAFRAWHPGAALAAGPLGIPYPIAGEDLVPDGLLVPLLGWDQSGHRLGYGGGYFDRTLAALGERTLRIGVGYEIGRLDSIDPQPWDQPMHYIVTERALYKIPRMGSE